MQTKRPPLTEIPLSSVVYGPGARLITMSRGQWDSLLLTCFQRFWVLLEIENEIPVRAFLKSREN